MNPIILDRRLFDSHRPPFTLAKFACYMPAMENDPQAALAIFATALRKLLQDDELIYADPAERAIVARLGVLLDGQFPGWSIGVEWNRREDVIKRLRYGLSDDELEREGAIVPDLIVHRVGKKENLLVVEVKKARNKDYEGDIWKLQGMTHQAGAYAYSAGLHLVIDMPKGTVTRCDVYIDAALDEALTGWLRKELP